MYNFSNSYYFLGITELLSKLMDALRVYRKVFMRKKKSVNILTNFYFVYQNFLTRKMLMNVIRALV